MPVYGTNVGHGHVWERPDGVKMRCGGPGMCGVCAKDAAALKSAQETLTANKSINLSDLIKKSAKIINEYRKFMMHWQKLTSDFIDELDKTDLSDNEKTAVLSGFMTELKELEKEYDK
jgi:hypothetical protein